MDKKGETITREPGSLNGYDFVIDGCEGCEIRLLDRTAQIQLDYCKDCKILIGPVGGSVFARNCERCVILGVCQQLRTRECVDCDLLLQIPGHPIIETSRDIRFGPLPSTLYPELLAQMQEAGLKIEKNEWNKVYDFSPDNPPGCVHFTLLSDEEAALVLQKFPARPGEMPEVDVCAEGVEATDAIDKGSEAIEQDIATESSEVKVTSKQTLKFYIGLCRALLEGRPEKDGRPALPPKSLVTLSGVGSAVVLTVQVAARLERDGAIKIKSVSTSFVTEGRSQASKISIVICRTA